VENDLLVIYLTSCYFLYFAIYIAIISKGRVESIGERVALSVCFLFAPILIPISLARYIFSWIKEGR